MKQFNLILVFLFALSAWSFEVPPLTGPVVDQAGLLSSSEQNQIAQRLYAIKAETGEQIQVLIVPSLSNEPIEQAAIQVFDQWKLGDAKKDNGVLFLVSTAERKLRIEVGQGLEGNIPDIIAKRIISEVTRPLFKTQNYHAGVLLTTEAIHQAAAQPEGKIFDVQAFKEGKNVPSSSGAERPERGGKKVSSPLIFLILGALWLIIFIVSPSTGLWILFSLLSGGRGRGGFSGGGGGWSGGGGSSSGGGASGDW